MAKDDYDKLMKIALRLRISDSPFFRNNHIGSLQAFVRDGGVCQYCASRNDLYESYAALGNSATDHLLPKNKYKHFKHEPRNLVASCVTCNKIKNRWDPATDARGEQTLVVESIAELETHRGVLIERTRKHIHENPDKWQEIFEHAQHGFKAAAAEYRLSVEEPNAA